MASAYTEKTTEIVLKLTPEEVEGLYVVLMHVGGEGSTAAHHSTMSILKALGNIGFPVNEESRFSGLVSDKYNSFHFVKDSYEKIKKRAKERFNG